MNFCKFKLKHLLSYIIPYSLNIVSFIEKLFTVYNILNLSLEDTCPLCNSCKISNDHTYNKNICYLNWNISPKTIRIQIFYPIPGYIARYTN